MESVILIALLITSVAAVTFIVERGLALRAKKVIPQPLIDAVLSYGSGRDLQMLKSVCAQNACPLAKLLLFSADHLDMPKGENSALLETRARYEISKLERGLIVLEIIVGIAPLTGLVGTIFGLIVGAFFAYLILLMNPGHALNIMLPGSLVGLIVGYAAQQHQS